MPTLCRFNGIKIQIFFQEGEHNFPHFHAWYDGTRVSFSIETGELLAGSLPDQIVSLIQRWHKVHKEELEEVWRSQIPKQISSSLKKEE